jgi:hypothetical protein
MAAKVKRGFASLPIAKYYNGGYFSVSEVKSELADLSVSQGGLMTNLEGVVRTISKNESTADFRW